MMAEPLNTAITTAAVTTGGVALVGTFMGVPIEAITASLVGAALALNASAKLEFSIEALRNALGIFVLSLACGIYLGGIAAQGIDAMALKWLGVDFPDDALRTSVSFLASLGAQRLAPEGLERLAGLLRGRKDPAP